MRVWRYGFLYAISTLVGLVLALSHASFLAALGAVAVLSAVVTPIFFILDARAKIPEPNPEPSGGDRRRVDA